MKSNRLFKFALLAISVGSFALMSSCKGPEGPAGAAGAAGADGTNGSDGTPGVHWQHAGSQRTCSWPPCLAQRPGFPPQKC